MPERFAALLAVALLVVVVWGLWQLYKARHRVRLQGTGGGISIQEDKKGSVLLVFTAPDCSICKRKQLIAMEEVALELGEALSVSEIDVASQPELAAQYAVVTVPSSVVIDTKGNVQAMNHGFASAEKLRLQLQQVLAPSELSENNSQALSA
jgi:thioredoxin-like negative regulator of GroEL